VQLVRCCAWPGSRLLPWPSDRIARAALHYAMFSNREMPPGGVQNRHVNRTDMSPCDMCLAQSKPAHQLALLGSRATTCNCNTRGGHVMLPKTLPPHQTAPCANAVPPHAASSSILITLENTGAACVTVVGKGGLVNEAQTALTVAAEDVTKRCSQDGKRNTHSFAPGGPKTIAIQCIRQEACERCQGSGTVRVRTVVLLPTRQPSINSPPC
jgi:hypothetical protein